jgi:hypothetical protein
MTNSWTNEEGEPIMDGAAWRFEQQLDMDAQADYDADHFYDNEPPEGWFDCDVCGSADSVDPEDGVCADCGADSDDEPPAMEDQWLDCYMEDRISTMYEG